MGIRQKVADLFLGEEKHRLQEVLSALVHAYESGPYEVPPEILVDKLAEIDSIYLMDLLDKAGFEILAGTGSGSDVERERKIAVQRARTAFRYDPVTDFGVSCWTNFGFGETVEITPKQPESEAESEVDTAGTEDVENPAAEVWAEFWDSPRNRKVFGQRRLHELSNQVLIDGEFFFTFFVSTVDGEATVRVTPTDEIARIVYDPKDASVPLFYERRVEQNGQIKTIYYPDWLAGVKFKDGKPEKSFDIPDVYEDESGREQPILPRGAVRADILGEESSTFVCMMHVAHNLKRGDRGWPITTSSVSWSAEHKRFRENRAAVAAAVAMYVNKLKVKGGSRSVADMLGRLQSGLAAGGRETNPPVAAGSTLVQNEAVDTTRFPLTTGAGDAKSDGESLLLMAGLGLHVYPHWLGAGDAYRLATASAMEAPLMRNFGRYQVFWSSVWQDVVTFVLMMKERYGRMRFETYEADISSDQLIENDLVQISGTVGAFYEKVVLPMAAAGILDPWLIGQITGQVIRIMLQGLGVSDSQDLIKDLMGKKPADYEKPEDDGDSNDDDDNDNDDDVDAEPDGEPEELLFGESHDPTEVNRTCPLGCGGTKALSYPDHKGLLVCTTCFKTYDPEVE